MPRRSSRPSAAEVILQAVESVAERASAAISRAIADILAARIDQDPKANMAKAVGRGRKRREGAARAKAASRAELRKWVADRRARRVPTFVIEQTGLKTKKQIVAKFGADAPFEKGKALPKAK
jgi:hypothetical protein